MNDIQIKNNRILYYGNTAGYIARGTAVVDPMFQTDELKSYLSNTKGLDIQWTPGTFERLATGKLDPEGNVQLLKSCRVWQLKPDADVMMKFIGYDELLERFGEPDPDNYRMVFDGGWTPMIWRNCTPNSISTILPATRGTASPCRTWSSFTTVPAAPSTTSTALASRKSALIHRDRN